MAITQRGRQGKKPTGGTYHARRAKVKHQSGRLPTLTKIGTQKIRPVKRKGGGLRMKVIVAQVANLYDPKTKKYGKSPIKTVAESTANRHFLRRNIIVKGTIIETEAGKARVTSRPGQDGTVNAVLI